jgi:hypothetical protein
MIESRGRNEREVYEAGHQYFCFIPMSNASALLELDEQGNLGEGTRIKIRNLT